MITHRTIQSLLERGRRLRCLPVFNPPPWRLLQLPSQSRAWGFLALAAVPFICFCAVGITYRMIREEGDFLGFSASVAQIVSLLALLGLGMSNAPQRLQKGRFWHTAAAWGVTLLLAAALIYLPGPLSWLYNTRGAEALAEGRLSAALDCFRWAVALAPDNAKAHYNLGNAYQTLHNFDRAIAEYQSAVELDDTFASAYNNLGQLYLSTKRDPEHALAVLLAGLAHTDNPIDQAVAKKNIGWAYLVKEWPQTALGILKEAEAELNAIEAAPKRDPKKTTVVPYLAETFRLMALANEALHKPDEATKYWHGTQGRALAVVESEACVTPPSRGAPECLNAQVWAAEAAERLKTESRGD